MIYAFTGKTGSGKTFNMVKHAYKYWKSGVDVYSNTVLNFSDRLDGYNMFTYPQGFSYFEKGFFYIRLFILRFFKRVATPATRGKIIYFEDISEILEARNGLILFDEAQVLFNARNWESLPNEFQYKLQQHRKHRLDLFCTTQNIKLIDVNYRRLVQFWLHHEPVFQIGGSRLLLGLFRIRYKDIDMLWESVDELKVDDVKVKFLFIHKFSRALYDTLYDIGFKRFKTIWLTNYNELTNESKNEYLIIPKEMSLSDAQKVIRLLKFGLVPNKFPSFKKT